MLLSSLHSGALLNPPTLNAVTIKNRHLLHFRAEHWSATNASLCGFRKGTEGKTFPETEGGHYVKKKDTNEFINMKDHSALMLNAPRAPAADAVVLLELTQTDGKDLSECFQMKLESARVSKDVIAEERKKSCDEDDFLMVLCTASKDFAQEELPAMTGLVTSEQYVEYYGPYAGRAFLRSRFEPT